MQRPEPYPVIIGIVGDSGAGKTTFAAGLAQVLGQDRTLSICIDDYHRYSRKQRAENGLTPHDPACNYLDILEQHVDLLRSGQPVLKPVYNHNGGILEPPEYVEPKPFIILEGLLGYTAPGLRDAYDVKFYLDPLEKLRLRWKFQRDTGPGGFGYSVEQVMTSLPKLQRDSKLFVEPQRSYADMVVSFFPPEDRPDETGGGLNVRHILRPTLPYIDLAPLLEVAADHGVELELARDVDGRPADALQVSGHVDAAHAEAMMTYLWDVVADGRGDRPKLGAYRDADNTLQYSYPLALSQLLIAHYLLTAAPGHHDV